MRFPFRTSVQPREQRRRHRAGQRRLFADPLEARSLLSGLTALASFGPPGGETPEAALIMDASGNLYGTTADGGASGDGTIFELVKGSKTITVLASLDSTDGANPAGGVIMDGNGNLYGTAEGGGTFGYGTIFELANGGSAMDQMTSAGRSGSDPSTGGDAARGTGATNKGPEVRPDAFSRAGHDTGGKQVAAEIVELVKPIGVGEEEEPAEDGLREGRVTAPSSRRNRDDQGHRISVSGARAPMMIDGRVWFDLVSVWNALSHPA
jgi:uncharacterized repeat protein (TIGR03803 family)